MKSLRSNEKNLNLEAKKKVRAYLKSEYKPDSIPDIILLYCLPNGHIMVNAKAYNPTKQRIFDVFFHLKDDPNNPGELCSATGTAGYEGARYEPITETTGTIFFNFKLDYQKYCFYNTEGITSSTRELFHFSEISPYYVLDEKSGEKLAKIKINISKARTLVFYVNKQGSRVSPIYDSRYLFRSSCLYDCCFEPQGSIDDYTSMAILQEKRMATVEQSFIEDLPNTQFDNSPSTVEKSGRRRVYAPSEHSDDSSPIFDD